MANPQYLNRHDARNVSTKRKIKTGKRHVAIDVRVSTQHEMQINALGNQKQWAIELAQDNEDWIFDPDKDLYVDDSGKIGLNQKTFTTKVKALI